MVRRKIAFIEFDTHSEISGNILELSRDSTKLDFDFFFSQKIADRLQIQKEDNIFVSDHKKLLNDLSKRSYSLLIIGTAHRYFSLWKSLTKNFPTALIVHNKKFAALSSAEIKSLIFKNELLYRFKLLTKEGLLSSPQVFQQAKTLFVLDPALADERHDFLPVFFQQHVSGAHKGFMTVVIPGAVDTHRRDYEHIFKKLNETKFEKPHHFIFLGKAGPEMLEKLQKLQDTAAANNFSIEFFREKVPQPEFDRLISTADVLWCPIQQRTSFFSQEEIYGKTKMTGNIGDAIKFGKPAIFPAWYPSNLPFIFPEEEDLEKQFAAKSVQNMAVFEPFSKEMVLDQFEKIILKILKEK